MFHAMVSVMAVKIQLSSPKGVLRSVCLPGMRSMSSLVSPSCRMRLREQNQRSATCRQNELMLLCRHTAVALHTPALCSSAFGPADQLSSIWPNNRLYSTCNHSYRFDAVTLNVVCKGTRIVELLCTTLLPYSLAVRYDTQSSCERCEWYQMLHQLERALMGVVKHAVKTSAGTCGDCGSSSLAPQAASRMQSLSPS